MAWADSAGLGEVWGGECSEGTQHLSALRHSLQMAEPRSLREARGRETQIQTDRERVGDRLTECETL